MSIKLMSAIWTHPELSSGSTIVTKAGEEKNNPNTVRTMKMVLLAIADMANDEGVCWPSYRLLAEKVNITDNYLRRGVIPKCEANGWLERKSRLAENGRQTSNYYVMNVGKILQTTVENQTPPTHTEQGGGGHTEQGSPLHTEHPLDPSLESSKEGERKSPPTSSLPESSHNKTNGKQAKMTGDKYLDAAASKFNRQQNGYAEYPRQATPMQWNKELPIEERRPIAEALARITGKQALWDAGDEKIHIELHEGAITAYKMEYTAEMILALQAAWQADWRGKNGGSVGQCLTFLSEHKTQAKPGSARKKYKATKATGDMQ